MTVTRGQQGFTLTELLVVLAIISMAAVVSLPYAGANGETRRLDSVAQRVAAALRITRDTAIARNSERRLVVDLEHRIVTGPDNVSVEIPEEFEITVMSAAGESLSKSAAFRFFPDGGSTGGNIVLASGDAFREIAVNWLTGAVAVEDLEAK